MALTAELGAQVGGPQALGPHLVLQRIDDRAQRLVGRGELEAPPQQVERLDLRSARTSSAQSSLGWNSGSVSKSQAIRILPSSSVAE